jgi:uncharacterized membrane protein YqaE (UPF0057 family)
MDSQVQKLIAVILAIILPPLGVVFGGGNVMDVIINIILTLFFFVPGLLHALYVILAKNNADPIIKSMKH